MAVADLAHPLEVAGRRGEAAAGILHRLQVHGGDRLGVLREDGLLDGVGGPAAEGHDVVLEVRRPVEVGVGHLEGPGHQRFERGADLGDAGDGEGPHGGAVVRDVTADDLVPLGLADQLEVLAGQLPRRLDGLGAAGGEEDPVEVAGRQVGDLLGQLDGLRVRVAPHREVGQLGRLLGSRLHQFHPTVAELAGEQAGQAVQVALAVLVVDPHALAVGDDRDLLAGVVRHAGEVHPQVAVGALLQGFVRILGHRVPHV